MFQCYWHFKGSLDISDNRGKTKSSLSQHDSCEIRHHMLEQVTTIKMVTIKHTNQAPKATDSLALYL